MKNIGAKKMSANEPVFRDAQELKQGQEVLDINNFQCYFPGGSRRKENWPYEKYPEKYKKIISDLDRIIEEENLNVDEIIKERNQAFELSRKAISRMYSRKDEALKLAAESETHAKRIDALIYPIYKKMIEQGYTDEELIC